MQSNKPFVPLMAGLIPDGWPGAGTSFRVRFGADGVGIAPDEVANYLVRMASSGVRLTAADPGEASSTEIVNRSELADRHRQDQTSPTATTLSELKYFSPKER